jgi:hypothetical protein
MTTAALSLLHSMRCLLIDFPVFLLIICPLLNLIGAAMPPLRARPWLLAALLALAVGTGSLFIVFPSAKSLGPLGSQNAADWARLCIYEGLATEAKIIFTGLTVIDIAVFFMPDFLHRRDSRLFSTVLPLSFLILYSAGATLLVQTVDSAADAAHRMSFEATPLAAAPQTPLYAAEEDRK